MRPRGRPARGRRDRPRQRRRAGRRRTIRRSSRSRWRRASATTATRRAALDALPQVARTGTHLFQFAQFVEGFRGWGRSLRRAVGRWYAAQPVDALAYQAVKYRQREGVTHRDLLRLAHPARRVGAGNPTLDVSARARAAVRVDRPRRRDRRPAARSSRASPAPRRRRRPRETAALVREYRLPREALQPEHLTSPEVWEALLDDMPMTALIRNLATMTRVGVLAPGSDGTAKVVAQLGDAERHPRGAGAPDRRARRAADVRVRPRCARPRRVEPGARDRRRARRRVLHGVRQRRADGHAPAARARRVGLDERRLRRRRAGPDPARRVGGARARDGGDRGSGTRSSASSPARAASGSRGRQVRSGCTTA